MKMGVREKHTSGRYGNINSIEFKWSIKTKDHAVLIALCPKYNDECKLIGTFSAYKEAYNLHCDPEQFAEENKWYQDLTYEIADQIQDPPFGVFETETYISIHNTSIRTRA